MKHIAGIMEKLRNDPPKSIADIPVSVFEDLKASASVSLKTGVTEKISLPKSNVLIFRLDGGSSIIVRPSGTEPKIKLYVYAVGEERGSAETLRARLVDYGTKLLGF